MDDVHGNELDNTNDQYSKLLALLVLKRRLLEQAAAEHGDSSPPPALAAISPLINTDETTDAAPNPPPPVQPTVDAEKAARLRAARNAAAIRRVRTAVRLFRRMVLFAIFIHWLSRGRLSPLTIHDHLTPPNVAALVAFIALIQFDYKAPHIFNLKFVVVRDSEPTTSPTTAAAAHAALPAPLRAIHAAAAVLTHILETVRTLVVAFVLSIFPTFDPVAHRRLRRAGA